MFLKMTLLFSRMIWMMICKEKTITEILKRQHGKNFTCFNTDQNKNKIKK